jgi:hypothetical protein
MASYERINYALRPAKTIERKMLADGFQRLTAFATLSSYRYIGFGSTYFSDFIMFHRALNITNMLSIEKDVENADRFEFNLPFKCVKMAYGKSTDVLPTLKWSKRTIAWLDYDGPLTADVLADVAVFSANAASGSVLVISVNANAGDDENDPSTESIEGQPTEATESNSPAARAARRLERFKGRVGHAKVPTDVTAKDMRQWLFADACKRIVTNEINGTIRARNGVLEEEDRFIYSQLFNIHYADGAKMLTVGGIIYTKGEEPHFREAMFDGLPFVCTNGDAYAIEVPNLTYREIRSLEKQMPCAEGTVLKAPGVPVDDTQRYARVYRYFPTFAETDV